MCGHLLWVPAFHPYLYLSHLNTSDSLNALPPCGFRPRGERWKAERLGQCLSLLCFQYFFSTGPCCDDLGVSVLGLAMGAEVHIFTYIPFCLSCCWLPSLLYCSLPATLLVLINPQVWYPELSWYGWGTWASKHRTGQRDMSKQAQDRTDCLSSPESLHDLGSTRVFPFYSWYEGK